MAAACDVIDNHGCWYIASVLANWALSWIYSIATFVLAIVDIDLVVLPCAYSIDQNVVASEKLDLKSDNALPAQSSVPRSKSIATEK